MISIFVQVKAFNPAINDPFLSDFMAEKLIPLCTYKILLKRFIKGSMWNSIELCGTVHQYYRVSDVKGSLSLYHRSCN